MNADGRSELFEKLPGADGPLMSASYAAVMWSAALLSVISVIAAVVSTSVFGKDLYVSLNVLAVPFLVLGVYGYVRSGHWLILASALVVSAVMYLAGPAYSWLVLVFAICTQGVVVVSDSVQRFLFFKFCNRLESYSTRHVRGPVDSILAFALDVPQGYDTRNLVMDPHAIRNRFPWKDITKISMLALLFSMPVLAVLAVSCGDMPGLGASVGLLSVCGLYAALLAVPFSVLLSTRLGLRSGKNVFDVSEGMSGTSFRMLVIGIICVLAAAIFSGIPLECASIPATSVLLTVMLTGVSCVMYCAITEAQLVRDIAGRWEVELPLGRFEEKAGRAGGFGAPGTPERDRRSCYKDRGDQ